MFVIWHRTKIVIILIIVNLSVVVPVPEFLHDPGDDKVASKSCNLFTNLRIQTPHYISSVVK